MKTRKILIPIDLNHGDRTDAMLEKANEVAGENDVDIILLNVIPDIPPYVAVQLPENVTRIAANDAQAGLKLLASKHGIESKAKIRVDQGNPAQLILKVAKDLDVDLIVIGSHQPGLADYLIGSVAGRVVRHAECSVLVVR